MGKVRDRPGGLETFTFSTTDRLLVRQCHSTLNVVAYATVCRHADMPHSCGTGNERIRVWRVNLGETAARSKWDAAADWRSNGRLDSFRVQGISDCRCLRILIDARVLPC